MGVTVVVGGQFGSEGKGKVAQYLAATNGAVAAIRVGGSNSGHTGFRGNGELEVLRQLPTAALLPDVACVIGPGSYVDVSILLDEIERTRISSDRLIIDESAFVITADDIEAEARSGLQRTIGSTGSGTGEAVRRRVDRNFGALQVRDVPELGEFSAETATVVRSMLERGESIVVEGTQGFGLSLLHSPYYPYVTSRDTSAAGAVAEAGLSPLDVDQVVVVLRALPIRVGGNSGPLPNEIDWETAAKEAGAAYSLEEFTSVTGRLRRVARFDPEIVRRAIEANAPSLIVLNHLDQIDAATRDAAGLTDRARTFVEGVEAAIGNSIGLTGVGPSTFIERPANAARAA